VKIGKNQLPANNSESLRGMTMKKISNTYPAQANILGEFGGNCSSSFRNMSNFVNFTRAKNELKRLYQ